MGLLIKINSVIFLLIYWIFLIWLNDISNFFRLINLFIHFGIFIILFFFNNNTFKLDKSHIFSEIFNNLL